MTKRKTAMELTTEGAMRRLFPKEVRAYLRAAVREADEKAEKRLRGRSTKSEGEDAERAPDT